MSGQELGGHDLDLYIYIYRRIYFNTGSKPRRKAPHEKRKDEAKSKKSPGAAHHHKFEKGARRKKNI
jgi:hypothetical protein